MNFNSAGRGRGRGMANTPLQRPNPLPPFYDPNLPLEKRVDDLVSRLTLEEKVSLMGMDSRAIPRLGIASYRWWNEALHGIANGTATVFPSPPVLRRHGTLIFSTRWLQQSARKDEQEMSARAAAWTSGRQISIFFVTQDGDAHRRHTEKILTSQAGWRLLLSPACRETIHSTFKLYRHQNISRFTAAPSRNVTA